MYEHTLFMLTEQHDADTHTHTHTHTALTLVNNIGYPTQVVGVKLGQGCQAFFNGPSVHCVPTPSVLDGHLRARLTLNRVLGNISGQAWWGLHMHIRP